MVVRPDGSKYEPSVWDIEEEERSPKEIIGNWLCMAVAVGVVSLLLPFFLLCLAIISRSKDAKLVSSSIEPSLSGMCCGKSSQPCLRIVRNPEDGSCAFARGQREIT